MTDELNEEIRKVFLAYYTDIVIRGMRKAQRFGVGTMRKLVDLRCKAAVDEYKQQEDVRREKEDMRGES